MPGAGAGICVSKPCRAVVPAGWSASAALPVESCQARDLGGAVPARVERVARRRVGEGGRLGRGRRPGQAEGAVVLAAVGEPGVVADRAVGGELGEVRLAPPADEEVAVVEELDVAHEPGDQPVGPVHVGADERGAAPRVVEADQHPLRLRLHLGRRPVVEDAQQGAVPVQARVVLPGEDRAAPHAEVALLASEPPEDLAALAADQVHRPRVPGRDDEVAVGGDVDRVDVEVVVRVARLLRVALVERDVLEAPPLPEQPSAGDRHLLDDAADDASVRRAADGGEVHRHRLVARDVGGAAARQHQLVQVGRAVSAGREAGDLAVGGVEDDVLADAEAVLGLPLPPGEHGLAAVAARAEVHRRVGRGGVEPDDLAVVVEDRDASLARPRGRRDEDEAGGRLLGRVEHGDDRRHEVGARDEPLHAGRGGGSGVGPGRDGGRAEQQPGSCDSGEAQEAQPADSALRRRGGGVLLLVPPRGGTPAHQGRDATGGT